MQTLIWYLKQLLPLTYVSRYAEDDLPRLTIFKMWMGRTFAVQNYTLLTPTVTEDN